MPNPHEDRPDRPHDEPRGVAASCECGGDLWRVLDNGLDCATCGNQYDFPVPVGVGNRFNRMRDVLKYSTKDRGK